jgi:inosose dehydratase
LKEDLSFRGAFLEGAFTVPGDGCIDYKPLFDVLKEKNYSGWLVVEAEQDPSKANPFEYAKIGYKYLTGTLNKSNLEVFQN